MIGENSDITSIEIGHKVSEWSWADTRSQFQSVYESLAVFDGTLPDALVCLAPEVDRLGWVEVLGALRFIFATGIVVAPCNYV